MIELDNRIDGNAKLRVVGVGGGGGNCISSMIAKGLQGVEFVAVNTDVQALERNKATARVQIGKNLTRGLGAGADPSVGQRAAEEDSEELSRALAGSDMVFITAGMGGGTGTGAAPIVAQVAKNLNALVVAIVTKPFASEGKRRMMQAEAGINELKKYVDTLIVIPNQKLLSVVERSTPLGEALNRANDVLYNATRGISELITVPGFINVDFADVRTVMKESGDALMGAGVAIGDNRAFEAAHAAISSPLLEDVSIAGAQGVLVNITGSSSMSMSEFEEAANVIYAAAGDEANLILGAVVDDSAQDEMRVTVIATGFNRKTNLTPKKTTVSLFENVPSVPSNGKDKNTFEIPAFLRKSTEMQNVSVLNSNIPERPKINKNDPEKPAFLRRIMD
ncbi:MAG: cell division protein FtsZ [Bacteroidota bacterium]